MKNFVKVFAISAVAMSAGFTFQSCTSEAPFSTEGQAMVRLNVDVNSGLTRAVTSVKDLEASARIYISDEKGVLNKWTGTQNIPKDGFYLRYGSYVAEAFAGDSVSASFDKRYFKGRSEFTIANGAASAQVSVTCKIANAVVSIDEATVNNDLISNLKIEIGHSKGSLTFADATLLDYGYFMMPSDENYLDYTLTAVNGKGKEFTKSGTIADVRPGYNYRFRFSYNPTEGNDGGAYLNIEIEEENLIEDEVDIYGKPVFSWVGNDPKIEDQIIGTPGKFLSKTLRVAAYKGFSSVVVSTDNAEIVKILGTDKFDITKVSESVKAQLSSKGINFTLPEPKEDLFRSFIEFSADFLNSLPGSDTEYVMTVTATDLNGKKASYDVRIANTEAAIVYSDPVKVDTEALVKDLTAVRSTSATIPVNITKDDVENPAIQYRVAGTSAWTNTTIPVGTRSSSTEVKLTGLKPGTAYEFRVIAGALTDGKYEFESEVNTFTTESVFTIPNAGLEEWSDLSSNSKVLIPGAGGIVSFWDTGNHGSATMSKLVTNKSETMKHGGQAAAELKSQFVGVGIIGKFAAGNLFVGSYDKTDGTDGELTFGRPYDGSHPASLTLYANYRPGLGVNMKGADSNHIAEGAKDKGQIYVALTSEAVPIKTKTANESDPDKRMLFNPDANYVVAYGQVTWEDAFGADGQLEKVSITLDYKPRARTVKPTHLVIVCSASKYGDYFSGGEGSLLYVDDFELVYE